MYHPDKVADRVAGALVDIAYKAEENPRIAVEVLLGHGIATIIVETSLRRDDLSVRDVLDTVKRIAPAIVEEWITVKIVPQDAHLSLNQEKGVRCGDNGIFTGMPVTAEQSLLTSLAKEITEHHPYDGKYIIDGQDVYVCQSHAEGDFLPKRDGLRYRAVNPLGYWTGGLDTDSGATNRKLGSDMGDAVTGGGLHGKDLSKADVSVNIVCHMLAAQLNKKVTACCAIGDASVRFTAEDGDMIAILPFTKIVESARLYIDGIGGFERFAEWGLIR